MMTSWHGEAFPITGPFGAEPLGVDYFPAQRENKEDFRFFFQPEQAVVQLLHAKY